MSTEQFVAALTEYRLDPTEIAEILWLALRKPQPEGSGEPGLDAGDGDNTEQSGESHRNIGNQSDGTDGEQEGEGTDDAQEEDDVDASFGIAPELPSGILPKKALPISLPDADILDETLPLVRALKPLLKQIESQTVSVINEAETVDRIAETDIWSPILDPDQEPWFDVALVIDGSPAMSLWQRLIQDMQRLLRGYGTFQDFRVWRLVATDGDVGICAMPDRVKRSPNALLAPDSRRLILVFSDCTADYWWDGSLQPVLSLWGQSTPTAIWQVLPDWMWKRTALGVGEYVAIRNHMPGAKNTKLTPIYLSLRSSAQRARQLSSETVTPESFPLLPPSICIPVITADSKSLGAWSRMLAGDRRYSTPGFILPYAGWPPTPTPEPEAAAERSPQEDPLETFRLRATPAARRLAALLSAAPVITLPVMRLIRASDELLPGASPLPIAEVFLGGVLKKTPDQPATDNAELVQYTFPDDVRDRLLDVLPKVDAIEVIEAVSKFVAERLNCTLADFRALLLSPDLKAEADQYGLRSFATMTAQILRKFGSEFADLVHQLEGTSESGDSGADSDENDIDALDWLADFPLEDVEYEVAQYFNIPPLEPFNFNDAQLEDNVFPPPLETEDFTVVTVESQDDTPELEPFFFIVATVRRYQGRQQQRRQQTTEWEILRETREAHRFLQPLAGIPPLEMVAIPGGTFLMGSPDDEPNRSNRESPQHEVTIAPFFMGAHPVTQRQWRAIAELPQIEQELAPDPSHFKGLNHPVEKVSWYDAVEFCARLSAFANRQYRLPSEAEWEYACRAGTTTPFHFGETITAELANYRASSIYNGGPQGEYREETTPIDRFGIANAFGLSDMHGNVLEWCEDDWHENYRMAPSNGTSLTGTGFFSRRVRRGGSWDSNPEKCRSAHRDDDMPDYRNGCIGFRVCCSAPRTLQPPTG
jgi:formylglycine-generating enzyme required for sulfatase activity